jgi:hypothetical protein
MPIYHINVRTESHIASTVDVERESLTELRLEMARYVGELLKDHAELIWVDEDWQIDVTNSDGLILYVIHVSATETSATVRQPRMLGVDRGKEQRPRVDIRKIEMRVASCSRSYDAADACTGTIVENGSHILLHA